MKTIYFLLSSLFLAEMQAGQIDEKWIKKAVIDRFVGYVRIDTQSKEEVDRVPSTIKQFDLARILVREMHQIGLSEVRIDEEHCYVYATIPSNLPPNGTEKVPAIGFIAHMDAASSVPDSNVVPIIHRNYQGGDIVLPKDTTQMISVRENPDLLMSVGDDIITTDGTTLLGADDKAGIAEIMTAAEYLLNHPEIKHGTIKIAFTPDEEVGRGPSYFDIKGWGAKYAYTVDGGRRGELSDETFNAQNLVVVFKGRSTHPGSAKGIMVNSLYAASYFLSLFPADMKPETTEGRKGYLHPYDLFGNEEQTRLKVLVRDFDLNGLAAKDTILENMAEKTRQKFPDVRIEVKTTDTYRNMKVILEKYPQIVDIAKAAMVRVGVEPVRVPVRGGTDGSELTLMGLPTANIFAGEENPHGKLEWIPAMSMVKSVETIVNICRIWAEKGVDK